MLYCHLSQRQTGAQAFTEPLDLLQQYTQSQQNVNEVRFRTLHPGIDRVPWL